MLAFVATTAVCLLLLYRFHVEVGVFSEVMHEVSELIIVSVVTYFAYAVARLSRTHERAVARARENAYELRQGRLPPADRGEALDVLEQQVQACKRSLSELLASVGHARGEGGTQRGVDAMLFAVARECELLDPRVSVLFEPIAPAPPKIVEERALFDAFALLFKHCARSAPHNVQVAVHWDSDFLTLTLRNAQSPLRAARKTPYPLQGGTGAGGGLVLAASLLARFGATLAQLGDQDDSRLQVQLPMAAIGAAPPAGTKALRTGESLQELS